MSFSNDLPDALSQMDTSIIPFLDRDNSILSFNERVLDLATRPDVPLLERLRFVCIVSSNLDEFFEVRSAPHVLSVNVHGDGKSTAADVFRALSANAHNLVARQYQLFNETLMPELEKHGVHLLSQSERDTAQRRWVKAYFLREIRPLLIPVSLDPSHPFPLVANKALNFIVRLGGKDAFGRHNDVAIVKVPRVLPRVIQLPNRSGDGRSLFVSLASVVRAHITDLFPGRDILEFSQFRVTRHSDLAVDEEDVSNLRTALRAGLEQRHYGQAVRLEISSRCSTNLTNFLQQQFQLPVEAIYRVNGPVNLVRLTQLVDLIKAPELLFPPYKPSHPQQLLDAVSLFEKIKQGDVCIHQPFESFDGVLEFLREAVNDPQVLAIKQTIYRTGSDSELMVLLREAVRRGKEVTVVVELKARFDEEANINWAEMLESIGAQVLYGVVGLKTHAKMLLVTRREGKQLKRYAHLSTGNYNPKTARLYTDVSYLTANPMLTLDVENVFLHLANQSRLPKLRQLVLAPLQLHKKMVKMIESLGTAAAAGQETRLIGKMNALTDEGLMRALIKAGQQGVKIDLIVRGACMLSAQVPGLSENIRVCSIIGRFLEHSRVFYFRAGAEETLYLSSADWMNRNMFGRIELAWPVTDPVIRQRIIDECLLSYLNDTQDAWDLQPDGTYTRPALLPRSRKQSTQVALMARYSAEPKRVPVKSANPVNHAKIHKPAVSN